MIGKYYAIYCLIVIMVVCIFLIWYIKKNEKKFIIFLYNYHKKNMYCRDIDFYILNIYIAIYVCEKPIYNFEGYNKLLNKYLKNNKKDIDK